MATAVVVSPPVMLIQVGVRPEALELSSKRDCVSHEVFAR